jgi:hypothetical protein
VRQFSLRGLEQVKTAWLWLASLFNLTRLFGLMTSGVDPPTTSPGILSPRPSP